MMILEQIKEMLAPTLPLMRADELADLTIQPDAVSVGTDSLPTIKIVVVPEVAPGGL